MKIDVSYQDGTVWSCTTDTMGAADTGKVCAAAGTIKLSNEQLIYSVDVMEWDTATWRKPQGVLKEWTSTEPASTSYRGRELRDVEGAMASIAHVETKDFGANTYILRTSAELEGAISIAVDGALVYSRENDKLVAVNGNLTVPADQQMPKDFATEQRPRTHVHDGITAEKAVKQAMKRYPQRSL